MSETDMDWAAVGAHSATVGLVFQVIEYREGVVIGGTLPAAFAGRGAELSEMLVPSGSGDGEIRGHLLAVARAVSARGEIAAGRAF